METFNNIKTQPHSLGDPPGATPVNGVTIRCMQHTTEDIEFAGRIGVEALKGKLIYNVTERKLPIAVRYAIAFNRCQNQDYFNNTFIAEIEGRRVGIVYIKFKGDTENDPEDFSACGEFGCWHACRLICFGCTVVETVKTEACYVDFVAVDESARGKGVGKILMDRADYEARARNCKYIYLDVLTDNRAKNLYDRQGYQVQSIRNCYGCLRCCIGPPGAFYRMVKQLS